MSPVRMLGSVVATTPQWVAAFLWTAGEPERTAAKCGTRAGVEVVQPIEPNTACYMCCISIRVRS